MGIFQMLTSFLLLSLALYKHATRWTTFLNNVSTFAILFITSINLVISGLGIDYGAKEGFNPFNLTVANATGTYLFDWV
jgi:hypothetical protein